MRLREPSAWGSCALLTLGFVGCGGEHPVDRMIELQQRKLEVFCSCPGDRGFDTAAECRDYYASDLTESEAECVRTLYDSSSEELEPFLSCRSDADEAYYVCVANLLVCPAPSDASAECIEAYQSEVAACPDLTSAVAADYATCF